MSTEDLPDDPDWTDPERELLANARTGKKTVLGSGDPSHGESWGPDRTIRAAVIRHLLTDPVLAQQIVRLRLTGARIKGELDFEAATLNGTLELTGCHASEIVNLEQATAPAVYLEGCHLAGLLAAQLHTRNSLILARSTCAFAVLTGARIDGHLGLRGAVFPGGEARSETLAMTGISVGSNAHFKGITVTGRTELIGARIGGQLNFRKATMNCRGGCALVALELQTGQDVYFDEGFSADGAVDLTGAVIGGSLTFGQATLHHPGKNPVLDLARVRVKQNLTFGDGFTAEGMVLLAGATVDGHLLASGGQFLHPSDTAIDARGLKVRDVEFATDSSRHETDRNGFRADGKVILADAVIAGTLDCRGGSISHPRSDEDALDARGMKITRDLLLSEGFTATGRVALTGAEIGGQAILSGGSFKNAGQVALSAQQLTVRTKLLLQASFLADGLVDLSGATVGQLVIGGQVHRPGQDALVLDGLTAARLVEFEPFLVVEGTLCMRAARVGSDLRIIKPNLSRGRDGVALDLEGTAVTGTLLLKGGDSPVGGRVDLRQATVGLLKDDPTFWPEHNTLLADFTYDSLGDVESRPVTSRIDWLRVRGAYSAQIYEQLAAVYRAAGREDFARDVLYNGQKRRPRPGWREKFWSGLLLSTVGYGYHPARVLYVLVFLEAFGIWYFSTLGDDDLKPSSALLSAYAGNADEATKHLQPALYTLDLLLPVVSFGQRALWLPQGVTSWVVTFLMVAGWVLGAILVYGISLAYQRRSS